ncbi:MAG: helix-turn-helix transcriptional regulator [Candidatus Dadabacteria bacterium]|nr:helix-turn-helix transcriptional regulator [Candidatus Dadabacteria bacterium]
MTFGDYIRAKRKQKKVTQETLADYLGVSKVYVHQIETGKADSPSRDRCRQIAKFLKVSFDETWKRSRQERLRKFVEREHIDKKDLEILTDEERYLVKLYRVLDNEVKKDFNGMVFMLFKHYKNSEVRKILEEFLKCA